MPAIVMHADGDGCWPDLQGTLHSSHMGEIKELAYLKRGMTSGAPSIALLCEMGGWYSNTGSDISQALCDCCCWRQRLV